MELWERLKYLTVKDVFWCGLLKFDVPYKRNTIRFMRSIFIIVIGGNQQLGILRGEKKKTFITKILNLGIRRGEIEENVQWQLKVRHTRMPASPEWTSRDM